MRGRGKGLVERIVLQAHQNEALARQKILLSPEHYLPRSRFERREEGHKVAAMFSRMQKAGASVTVKRIQPKERRQ